MTDIQETIDTALAQYSPTDAAIAEMAEKYTGLAVEDIDNKTELARVTAARLDVKKHRVAVERTRKLLKADALSYGKAVDGEAKRLKGALLAIEEPLLDEENRVKEIHRERERRAAAEKAEMIRARLQLLSACGRVALPADVEDLSEEEWVELLHGAKALYDKRKEAELAEANRLAKEREELEAEKRKLAVEKQKLQDERMEQMDREEVAERTPEPEPEVSEAEMAMTDLPPRDDQVDPETFRESVGLSDDDFPDELDDAVSSDPLDRYRAASALIENAAEELRDIEPRPEAVELILIALANVDGHLSTLIQETDPDFQVKS